MSSGADRIPRLPGSHKVSRSGASQPRARRMSVDKNGAEPPAGAIQAHDQLPHQNSSSLLSPPGCLETAHTNSNRSQRLPETDDPLHLAEAQRTVNCRAVEVADFGIRPKLGTTLSPPPLLSGVEKRRSHSLSTAGFVHKPAFEVRDAAGATALGVWPDRNFSEAVRSACIVH